MSVLDKIKNSDLFRKGGNLKIYGTFSIYINGSLLTEVTEISISRSVEAQEIHLVGYGFAGLLTSDPVVTVNVKNAIPSTAFEFDPGKFMASNSKIQFTLTNTGSNDCNFIGWIIDDNFNSAVNSSSSLSFTAKGMFSQFDES